MASDIHIALVNGTAADFSLAQDLCSRFSNLTVLCYRSKVCDRSIFANARFLCAEYLFEDGYEEVCVTDIDAVVVGKVSRLFPKATSNEDVFLKIQRPIRFPWYYAMGGFVYLRNGENARRLLRLFACYISSMYAMDRSSYWYSDQSALFVSLLWGSISFVRLGNASFADFWHQVGASKVGVSEGKRKLQQFS
ncbi:hypothetical protein [Wenzhouxiangella limi]|uniref:Nucleotide-diphospho-sugar transferase domain-containing protein n=1 Tax=Wenzhouxiangella limi TaxID=2707351 RepID=A0A845V7W2_9GAMM|nr:hypothetical protein [Wenzhouxiangella limi]NDY96271.1 hypothetical protein [Wenzhouxiangella limi]